MPEKAACNGSVSRPRLLFVSHSFVGRGVFFVKEEDGEMVFGTIISDSSLNIIGFAEDNNVRQRINGGLA